MNLPTGRNPRLDTLWKTGFRGRIKGGFWTQRNRWIRGTTGIFLLLLSTVAFSNAVLGQGELSNGARNEGTIAAVGEGDTWTLAAQAEDTVIVRVGTTGFTPRIQLFDPANVLVASVSRGNAFGRDDTLTARATNAGTYRVVVDPKYGTQTGSYVLNVARLPGTFVVSTGDDGGALPNGVVQVAQLPRGDLDLWSFDANAGDGLMLRMGTTNFTPYLRLYGPDGQLVGEALSGNAFDRDEYLAVTATNSGTYTLVSAAKYLDQEGSYAVHLARVPATFAVAPGDEGGELLNGVAEAGQLTLGDLELWSFAANAGDGLMLRVGSTNFTPWLRLYGPDGALLGDAATGNAFGRDEVVAVTAATTGTYTLVLSAKYSGQQGPYGLSLARAPGAYAVAPGDEGGELPNGLVQAAEMSLGDLDLWNFAANAGDGLMLRVGSTNFTPWLRLYGPDGALVGDARSGNAFDRDEFLTLTATNAGTYTLVLSAKYSGQAGSYGLHLARAPASFAVGLDDEGGALRNGATNLAKLSLGDLDVWSFVGTPGDSNVFRVAATNFTPWIRLFGPDGVVAKETTTGNAFARNGVLTYVVTNGGNYTLVVSATYGGQSGSYSLKQSRVAPDLILPEQVTLNETETLSVLVSAQDPDQPDKPLPFELLSGPPGMVLTVNGATNALLTWATTEAEGPGTHVVVARVTDLVNGTAFRRTNSFVVTVNEVNMPPQLTVPGSQVVDELTPLSVEALATDGDLPANPLTFSLDAPPQGMTIDPATGAIAWVPTELQGPASYSVRVVVTDDSPNAVNDHQLSVTNTFEVSVREVNLPPLSPPLSDPSGDELVPMTFQVTASDPDVPANGRTFSVVRAPAGVVIDPSTGIVSWTPAEAQGPSTNEVVVRIQDDGIPSLAVTNTVKVVVREVNLAPQAPPLSDQSGDELVPLTFQVTASDPDVPANGRTFSVVSAPAGVVIDPSTGIVSWTPAEAQGPSTNEVVVRVQDDGLPPLAVTNTVKVVVREVNLAPILTPVPQQETRDDTLFRLTLKATDADLPANQITYSLAANSPEGATIDPVTGELVWPIGVKVISETQLIVVRATDSGLPPLTAQQTVIVHITPPTLRLAPVTEQRVDEQSLISLTMAVTNSPQAKPPFIFSLQGAVPVGASINPTTGVLFWRPTEAQGPSTNPFTVQVTDSALPPNTTNQTFAVIVREVNQAPVITAIPPQRTVPGGLLTYTVQATDEDLPANKLSFLLAAGAPAGMTLQEASGVLTWSAPESLAGTTNEVTVRVVDDGQPPLEATRTFKVVVDKPSAQSLQVEWVDGERIQLRLTGSVGQTYFIEHSPDLRTWNFLTNFVSSEPITIIKELTPLPAEVRYYRAIAP